MVSSLLADALTDPTAVLDALFNDAEVHDNFPAVVDTHFRAVFSDANDLEEIPVLQDPDVHKHRDIVRFQSMIQDTSSSPEMYLSRCGKHCGGWGKTDIDAVATAPIDYANLRECIVLWAVSIPGLSPWCTSAHAPRSSTIHVPPYPHKFPVPGVSHLGVQIKVYNIDRRIDTFKSTELYTFVGIITSEPLHVDLELDAPRIVPTLHVLFSLPLPPTIVPRGYPDSLYSNHTRDELIDWIARIALADDHDAAEWVLLSAISRVQSRNPPILPLTLTISCFPSSKTEGSGNNPSLMHVLSQIIALLTTLPLSLETLNTTSFTPESKNEDLHSGWLQLPKGSLSLVTEGGVTEGTMSERGLTNLRTLQELMNMQTLEYVFPFSRFSFDTDVAVVVLVEGTKSAFFQTDVNVPLQPNTADFDFYAISENIEALPQDKLEAFRRLVGAAKVGNVNVSEETAKFIQEDFVSERQAAPSSKEVPSSHELIQRMMVARLMALSMQETEITVSIWEAAKALEARRKARFV